MRNFANSEDQAKFSSKSTPFTGIKTFLETEIHEHHLEIPPCNPFNFIMDKPILFVLICMGKLICNKRDLPIKVSNFFHGPHLDNFSWILFLVVIP